MCAPSKPTPCPVCSPDSPVPVTDCAHLRLLAAATKGHADGWKAR